VKWIIDDMVLESIAQVCSTEDLSNWPTGEFLVADATAQDAVNDPRRRRMPILQARSAVSGEPIFERFMVTVGSSAATILYSHLRLGRTDTNDLAEHESIAWALTHPEENAVLVTQDKPAAMLATAELGIGSVCYPYELWDRLRFRGHLTEQQFTDLMNAMWKRDKTIPALPWRMRPHP
jgi:hypothetical protein